MEKFKISDNSKSEKRTSESREQENAKKNRKIRAKCKRTTWQTKDLINYWATHRHLSFPSPLPSISSIFRFRIGDNHKHTEQTSNRKKTLKLYFLIKKKHWKFEELCSSTIYSLRDDLKFTKTLMWKMTRIWIMYYIIWFVRVCLSVCVCVCVCVIM